MTNTEIQAKIDDAFKAMKAALAALDEVPAGSLDAEEDMDILGSLATFKFALDEDMELYNAYNHEFEQLLTHPAVAS